MDSTFIIIIVIIAIVVLFTGIKEGFALSTGIITDPATLDVNASYYIGTRNATGDNPNCAYQFPLTVFKPAPQPVCKTLNDATDSMYDIGTTLFSGMWLAQKWQTTGSPISGRGFLIRSAVDGSLMVVDKVPTTFAGLVVRKNGDPMNEWSTWKFVDTANPITAGGGSFRRLAVFKSGATHPWVVLNNNVNGGCSQNGVPLMTTNFSTQATDCGTGRGYQSMGWYFAESKTINGKSGIIIRYLQSQSPIHPQNSNGVPNDGGKVVLFNDANVQEALWQWIYL